MPSLGELIFEQGIQKGLIKGLRQNIRDIIEIKFGKKFLPLINKIDSIDDLNKLEEIKNKVKNANSFEDVKSLFS